MDAWDILAGIGGAALVTTGVALIYFPAALIVAGGFFLYAYYLREISNVSAPRDPKPSEPSERAESSDRTPSIY